jgi:hypothetical protein
MGIDHKRMQSQTERAVVLQEEEEDFHIPGLSFFFNTIHITNTL